MIKPTASREGPTPDRENITQDGHRIPRWELLALGIILALALALRAYHLGYKSLWLDEVVYVRSAQLGGLFGPYGYASISHPPGYLFLLRVLSQFGHQEWLLRLPALIASVGGVAVLWALGRSTVRPIVGLVAALLLALSAIHIEYAQEAHSYGLFATLSTIQLWALFKAASAPTRPRTGGSGRWGPWLFWAIFAIAAIVNLYIHYYALIPVGLSLFVYPCFLLAVRGGPVGSLWTGRTKRRSLLRLLAVLALIGLLYLPQVLSGLLGSARVAANRSVGVETGTLAPEIDISPALFVDTLLAFVSNRQPWTLDPWLVLLTVACLLLGLAWLLWRRPPIGVAYLVWMVLPLPLIAWFAYRTGFSFAPRRLLFILPIFLLVVATGIIATALLAAALARRWMIDRSQIAQAVTPVVTGVLVIGIVWSSIDPLVHYYQRPKQNWRTLASILETVPGPKDAVVLLPSAAPPLAWYFDTTQAQVIDNRLVERLEELCASHDALYVAAAATGAAATEAEELYLQQTFIPVPLRLLTLYYRNCQPNSWYGQGAAPLFELAYNPSLPNKSTKQAQERFLALEPAAQPTGAQGVFPMMSASQLLSLPPSTIPVPADPVSDLTGLFVYQALVDPADSAALTRLGVLLAQDQTLEDAQSFLQRAVELDPQNWLAYALWAHYLGNAGRQAEGLVVIEDGQRALSSNPTLELLEVRLQGNEDGVSPALDQAVEKGRLALRNQDWDAAKSAGQSAIAQDPNHYEAHLLLGDAFRAAGDLDQATSAYQDAMALAPHLGFLHGRLAETLARAGQGKEALESSLNAVALDQSRWENWLALGRAYAVLAETDLSKVRWAEAALVHAAELAPAENQAPQRTLVELRDRFGTSGQLVLEPLTLEEIQTAVAEDPLGQRDLANSLLESGQSQQALTLFQLLVQANSQDRGSRMGLAAALAAQERIDEAMTEYDRINTEWPDFPYAWVRQGELLEQEGDLTDAIARYRSAATVAPNNPDARLVLAYALSRSGQVKEAIAEFEAGLALDPTREAARQALDRLQSDNP
jgi:Flp pilus assembly protein TadD/uncharacterized membrane protein